VKLGMVGLGRMGAGMTERLRRAGHEIQTYDPNVESTAGSLEELTRQLEPPRHVWLMIPAGEITEKAFRELLEILEAGDAIVDGGNSNFRDSQRRAAEARERNVYFLDVGVSGGIWGLREGFALMAGGDAEPIERLGPIFQALAPEGGFAHVGPSGAGHFVKMVHNGVEYGLMQAYAEGFDLMHASEFELDLGAIAELWRHGSVVRSWLLDLLARALEDDPGLGGIRGYVEDSGEGRWTVEQALEHAVPLHVITAALYARFASREDESFAAKVNAALRNQFGGHAVRTD
jgi:6-phosphogluconate dehydrogenase